MTDDTEYVNGINGAADYLNLSAAWLRRQISMGNSPRFVRPSPRTALFKKTDLDEWKDNWFASERHNAQPARVKNEK